MFKGIFSSRFQGQDSTQVPRSGLQGGSSNLKNTIPATKIDAMGFPISCVVSDISHYGEFVCNLCGKLIPHAASKITKCDHVFCKMCLERYFETPNSDDSDDSDDEGRTCPGQGCGCRIYPEDCKMFQKENRFAWRILSRVKTKCPLNEKCSWRGNYADVGLHMRSRQCHIVEEPEVLKPERRNYGQVVSPISSGEEDESSDDASSLNSGSSLKDARSHLGSSEKNTPPKSAGSSTGSSTGSTSAGTSSSSADDAGATRPNSSFSMPSSNLNGSGSATNKPPDVPSSPPKPSPCVSGSSARDDSFRKADEEKNKGNAEFTNKNYREAIDSYNKSIALVSSWSLGHIVSGKEAKNTVEDMSFTERDFFGKVYGNRAACWLSLGAYKEAIRDCQESLKYNEKAAKIWIRLATSYHECGDFEEAVKVLEKRLVIEKELDADREKKSKESGGSGGAKKNGLLGGMFKSAKEKMADLRALGSSTPEISEKLNFFKSVQVQLKSGQELISKGNGAAAVTAIRKAIEICTQRATSNSQSSNTTLQIWLGRALYATGNTNGADENHSEVKRLTQSLLRDNREFVEGFCMRGLAFFASDELDKAAAILKEALRLNPDFQEAKDVFRKIVKPLSAQIEEARKQLKERQYQKAIDAFTEVVDSIREKNILTGTDGTSIQVTYQTDAISDAGRQMLKAAETQSTILGLRNSTLMATILSERSTALWRLRKFDEAYADCTESIRLMSMSSVSGKTAILNRGECLLGLKRFQEAVDSLRYENVKDFNDDDEKISDLRRKAESELKKSKRPDYYRILSDSPSVKELLKLPSGTIWKTCGDVSPSGSSKDSSSDEEESEEAKKKRAAQRINMYANASQIKTAYRKRCLDVHPDKQNARLIQYETKKGMSLGPREKETFIKNTEEHFKLVQEAYDILSDPTKKRFYDDGYDKEEIEDRANMRKRGF